MQYGSASYFDLKLVKYRKLNFKDQENISSLLQKSGCHRSLVAPNIHDWVLSQYIDMGEGRTKNEMGSGSGDHNSKKDLIVLRKEEEKNIYTSKNIWIYFSIFNIWQKLQIF